MQSVSSSNRDNVNAVRPPTPICVVTVYVDYTDVRETRVWTVFVRSLQMLADWRESQQEEEEENENENKNENGVSRRAEWSGKPRWAGGKGNEKWWAKAEAVG